MRGNENTKRQLNNKGFSLVELLVALVLMAMLVSLAAYSIYMMRSGDTKRAAKTMSGEISVLRGNTLAMVGDWQYEIVNDNGVYKLYTYRDGVAQETTSLGGRIKVYYKNSESGTETLISDNTKVIIKFVQGSGKVEGLYTVDSGDMDTATDMSLASSVTSTGYCTFKITNTDGKSIEDFKVYYETGKVIME